MRRSMVIKWNDTNVNGKVDLEDDITVREAWDDYVAFLEFAKDKSHSGSSWAEVDDPSSWGGSVMTALSVSPNDGVLFGPWTTQEWNDTSMLGNNYTAYFRLKVTSNVSSSNVVYIDTAYDCGTVLDSMTIQANNFTSPNTWQEFQLSFTLPDSLTCGLEFRLQNKNNGVTDISADYVLLEKEV
jgi:hypothetical protein